MYLFDSHSHVNFNDFKDDYKEVIRRALDKDIGMIIPGSQQSTSKRAVAIANEYNSEKVYAAVGLHPIQLFEIFLSEEGKKFTSRAEEFDYDLYKILAQDKKVKAIGEVGLEYFHIKDLKIDQKEAQEKQKKALLLQIKLAKELNLPIILHCRDSDKNQNDAYLDLLEILKKEKNVKGVLHCYGCFDEKITKEFLKLGLYFSFNGVITFLKNEKFKELILGLPQERIFVETDCPYLTPEPYRGKRNEPIYVEFVAMKIAEFLGKNIEEVSAFTVKNSRTFFDL